MDKQRQRARLETISMIFGIVALVGCICIYISIPLGAIAAIFAVLSRGERLTFSAKSRVGLILGLVAIVATILFYGYAVYLAFETYGSWENILRTYADMTGISYEDLLLMLGY